MPRNGLCYFWRFGARATAKCNARPAYRAQSHGTIFNALAVSSTMTVSQVLVHPEKLPSRNSTPTVWLSLFCIQARAARVRVCACKAMSTANVLFPLDAISTTFPEDVDVRLVANSLGARLYVGVCQFVRLHLHPSRIPVGLCTVTYSPACFAACLRRYMPSTKSRERPSSFLPITRASHP